MYCHNVITVKTEYSIRKFVSAERWPKRVVDFRLFGAVRVPLATNISYWTSKIALFLSGACLLPKQFSPGAARCVKNDLLELRRNLHTDWKSDIIMYVNVKIGREFWSRKGDISSTGGFFCGQHNNSLIFSTNPDERG